MSEYVPAELRRLIAERARDRCEYCLLHEEDSFFPHEPDHIIATKHCGTTQEDNLAWACFTCNRFKGSDIASIDPASGEIVRLFHPRKDEWVENFRLEDGGEITGLTPPARATLRLPQINLDEAIESRRLLMDSGGYPS